jgi:hypothetical protein
LKVLVACLRYDLWEELCLPKMEFRT